MHQHAARWAGCPPSTHVRSRAEVDATSSPETDWGGYSGYVADLDGHLWEIAHNPFVRLADSGQMLLPDD